MLKDKSISKITKDPSLTDLNKDLYRNESYLSSEKDIISLKKSEENTNNKFDKEQKENTIINQNDRSKAIDNYNINYKIEKFSFNLICKNLFNSSDKKIIKENKKRGRKRNRDDINNNENIDDDKKFHDKFSDDNLRKKCKNIILKYVLEFINKKIKEKYGFNIGHGKFKKELKMLNQDNKVKSTVNCDKIFLNKKLKDIFSENISSRFNNFPKNFNKTLIETLLNDTNEERKQYFINLFDTTFLDCLKYFREDGNKLELNGLKTISEIKEELIYKSGKEYFNAFNHYLQYFEEIINQKKSRKHGEQKSEFISS